MKRLACEFGLFGGREVEGDRAGELRFRIVKLAGIGLIIIIVLILVVLGKL
jgi:hypothetical protein